MATRRTGVAFLALILTTNCVPWTQLAQGGPSAPHFVSFAESLVVVGACFAAAVLLILAWFLGRRLPMDWGPRISNPRDSGLMLAVLSAGLNLTLAFIIHWQQSNGPISLRTFGIVWVLVVLPTEIAAGFSKGRASIPTPESHYKPPPRRTATRIPAVSQPAISSSAPDPSK